VTAEEPSAANAWEFLVVARTPHVEVGKEKGQERTNVPTSWPTCLFVLSLCFVEEKLLFVSLFCLKKMMMIGSKTDYVVRPTNWMKNVQ
jgi:hypothetical protein